MTCWWILRDATGGAVVMDPNPRAHQILEDRAGVRWADFHPGTLTVRLVLPSPGWNEAGFYLRSTASDTESELASGREATLRELSARPPTLLRRGAIHDAFTRLFEEPFDQAALAVALVEPDVADVVIAQTPGADISPASPGFLTLHGLENLEVVQGDVFIHLNPNL